MKDLTQGNAKITDSLAIWNEILKITHTDEIQKYIREAPHKISIYLDFKKIDKVGFCKKLGNITFPDLILNSPDKAIGDIKQALNVEYKLFDEFSDRNVLSSYEELQNLNIRFYNLPKSIAIRNIRTENINTLIQIEGIISKQTVIRPKIIRAQFRCLDCGELTKIYNQNYNEFIEPFINCRQCEKKTKMEIYYDGCTLIDSQKIRVQENYDVIEGNEQPYYIDIAISDDLCGLHLPGNRVSITGVLRTYQKTKGNTKQTEYELYLDAQCVRKLETDFNDIQITEEDEIELKTYAFNHNVLEEMAESIAYSIYGHHNIKKAALLHLMSGNKTKKRDGSNTRGDIHILLAADPSTAKSVIMKSVIRLSPRGIFTTGNSSTSAGLTASAVKDDFNDGGWSLEAGALVLASGGHVALDEIHTLKKEAYASLYEAMEQQTCSVSKAGICATLTAECAVMGACNPKLGRFSDYENFMDQINLPAPLLSRFDLTYLLQDIPSKDKDYKISMQMMQEEIEGWVDESEYLSETFIRKYIAYGRRLTPKMTRESAEVVANYYSNKRSESTTLNLTARQNGGIIRLAQAHAKLRFSNLVELIDVNIAINMLDESIIDIASDSKGVVDIDRFMGNTDKKTRDLSKLIFDYISQNKSTVNDYKNVVAKKELIEVICANGQDRTKIEKRIDKMVAEGLIMEPRYGLLKQL